MSADFKIHLHLVTVTSSCCNRKDLRLFIDQAHVIACTVCADHRFSIYSCHFHCLIIFRFGKLRTNDPIMSMCYLLKLSFCCQQTDLTICKSFLHQIFRINVSFVFVCNVFHFIIDNLTHNSFPRLTRVLLETVRNVYGLL